MSKVYFDRKFNAKGDAPLSSMMESTTNPKVMKMEGEEIGACSLACNTSRVEGCARALGWSNKLHQASQLLTWTCINQATSWLVRSWNIFCRNPCLGLTRRDKKEAWEAHLIFLGVWESVRKWTFTLPSEFPLWELESLWTPESLGNNCRGQNPLDWKVFLYHWKNTKT